MHSLRAQKELNRQRYALDINRLQDWLIQRILLGAPHPTTECNTLIEWIHDPNVAAKCLLDTINCIESSHVATRLIRIILLHPCVKRVKPLHRAELTRMLRNITTYAEIARNLCDKTWLHIMQMSQDEPETILRHLLSHSQVDLCIRWTEIHPLSQKASHRYSTFVEIFRDTIKEQCAAHNNSYAVNRPLLRLIETMPKEQVISLYDQTVMSTRNLPLLRYLLDYLIVETNEQQQDTKTSRHRHRHRYYQRYQISLKILETVVPISDTIFCNTIWPLLDKPLLIIEQLLMNTHFELLAAIRAAITPLINQRECRYCSERRGAIYDDIVVSSSAAMKSNSFSNHTICDSSEFILVHNDDVTANASPAPSQSTFGQDEHSISDTCIDVLLRIYASKALNFRVIGTAAAAATITDNSSLMSSVLDQSRASLDSLCGTFVVPNEPVPRTEWIPDNEATHCMCCRRSAFTILSRRHHCRQCGRVVCHACSTHRRTIPVLYADVAVRVCSDCQRCQQSDEKEQQNVVVQLDNDDARVTVEVENRLAKTGMAAATTVAADWHFTGDRRHDQLLRDEFSFEYAPSVSLCLSILTIHSTTTDECSEFLLHHCRKFESLLRPLQPDYLNPEVDYALVTRMLHCLALAAKVCLLGGRSE